MGLWLIALATISMRQTLIYHDLETLYRDTIAKNPRGTIAYSNLAVVLNNRGETDEAVVLTRQVLALDPNDPIGHTNMAVFLLTKGKRDGMLPAQLDEAIEHLRRGLTLGQEAWGAVPDEPRVPTQLAKTLLQKATREGFKPEAVDEIVNHLSEALRLDPTYVDAEINLALALAAANRPAEAVVHAQLPLTLAPQEEERLRASLGPALLAEAHNGLAGTLASQGDFRTAAAHYAAAVALRPDFDRALNNLGVMMMKLGETDRAIHYFQEAVRQHPEYAEARLNLEKATQVRDEQTTPE